MTRLACITLLLLLPLGSSASHDQTTINDAFLGTWSGVLEVFHAPRHPDAPPVITYRFEIDEKEARVFLLGEEWQEVPLPDVISSTPNHALLAVSDVQEYWVEDFVIHLVLIDEDRLAFYVSRVVDNYRSEADSAMRHFSVYGAGQLKRTTGSRATRRVGRE